MYPKDLPPNWRVPKVPDMVPHEVFLERMSICEKCQYRKEDRCSVCGCLIWGIAQTRAKQCPVQRWRYYK